MSLTSYRAAPPRVNSLALIRCFLSSNPTVRTEERAAFSFTLGDPFAGLESALAHARDFRGLPNCPVEAQAPGRRPLSPHRGGRAWRAHWHDCSRYRRF